MLKTMTAVLKSGVIGLILLGGAYSPAHAELETVYERQQREDVTDMRNRREESERIERIKQDLRSQLQIDVNRAARQKASDRAYEAWKIEDSARWAARAAAAAEVRRQQTEINAAADRVAVREQIAANAPIRLAAIQELTSHPAPRAAPGAFSECDRLASARYDTTRPLGLEGLLNDDINGALAVPACTAELQLHPDSVRTKFELGRALLAGSRCAEGYKALWEANHEGHNAAAYAMSYAASHACNLKTPYETDMNSPADAGNGDAIMYVVGREQRVWVIYAAMDFVVVSWRALISAGGAAMIMA